MYYVGKELPTGISVYAENKEFLHCVLCDIILRNYKRRSIEAYCKYALLREVLLKGIITSC